VDRIRVLVYLRIKMLLPLAMDVRTMAYGPWDGGF